MSDGSVGRAAEVIINSRDRDVDTGVVFRAQLASGLTDSGLLMKFLVRLSDMDAPPKKVRSTMSKLDQFTRHEAMHTASIATDFVSDHLVDHHWIAAHPELKDKAEAIVSSLYDLYRAIAAQGEEAS